MGIDIDPLAVLISRVWTSAIDKEAARKVAARTLGRARREFKCLAQRDAYPKNADSETRRFIRRWFDPYARRQLTCLANAIRGCSDQCSRDVLWCGFSRLIITKQAGASLALDLAHSRPHKYFELAPVKPFANFMKAIDRVLENCLASTEVNRGPDPSIRLGDARRLPIRNNSIDLVLTSPPYLNAIDYLRCSKFSLVWMGFSTSDVRTVRSRSVGTEVGDYSADAAEILKSFKAVRKLSRHNRAVLARFAKDMEGAIAEVSRVLVPGGRAIYVVGENTIRGTYIQTAKIITALAIKSGLKLSRRTSRTLPANRRYLPPPRRHRGSAKLDSRMRREIILQFAKPKKMRRAA